jgi:UDP-N-acetylmuramate: L-alanyl-gamma-D-glutamyl-meso-diaminopimelate ligase
LREQGIELLEGFDPVHLVPEPDLVVIGNALSRGNPMVEYVLDKGLPYTSGPQWLQEHVLKDKWVLAVAGTHGKTTTSSMLAWILEYAGMKPGYLIGGIPKNFDLSARMGDSIFFVVEADEYDSAFFDKRSKFVHYRPRTAILNNLEFDHADIFADIGAIQRQFHHLLRTIPGNGLIIKPGDDIFLREVIEMGCWTPVCDFLLGTDEDKSRDKVQAEWSVQALTPDGSAFAVLQRNKEGVYGKLAEVNWQHNGNHNMSNALAAIIAARHAGVEPVVAAEALSCFTGVKRRMEELAVVNGVRVYDDFAHHPTAIETTLQGLRKKVGQQRVIAVIEPRSNTMRLGAHKAQLLPASACADKVYWYQPAGLDWDLESVVGAQTTNSHLLHQSIESIIAALVADAQQGDHVVIMSNGGFEGIHQRLLKALDGENNPLSSGVQRIE